MALTFDIRNFGARGDGTDDTRAIQAALDAAASRQGTVIVPEGVFCCGELHVGPGVGIAGFPTWSFRASMGSVLKFIDSSAQCLINLTGAFGATITGLCLHGQDLVSPQPIHGIMDG